MEQGLSKTRDKIGFFEILFWEPLFFAHWIPVIFVVSMVSVLAVNPALNPLFVAVQNLPKCRRLSRELQSAGLANDRF